MNRRAWIGICLAALLAFGVPLAAGAQEKKIDLKGQRLGLVFNAANLLLGIVESSDAVSAGLGLKYWLGQKAALRAVLDFTHYSDSDTNASDTAFGLSGTFEYHFVKGKVSPYTGGLFGVRMQTGDTNDLDLYLGGILGVEVRVLDYLGLFAEYDLRLHMNEPEFWIDLGLGNNAQLGVIVYLP
jgi:hypothetical protein